MGDGTYRAITDIKIGDKVTAVDQVTGQSSPEPVLEVIMGSGAKHLINIDLDGDVRGGLTATAGHPIWVEGLGWANAEDLVPGDSAPL